MKIGELQKLTGLQPGARPASPAQLENYLRSHGIDPDRFYQEMEMTNRFVDTHRDTTYTSGNVDLHSHSFYEILYCRTNCGAEYLVGTERYRLQKGDIIIIAPGISHRPILPEYLAEPYQRDVIWISQEFAERMRQAFPEDLAVLPRNASLLRTAGTRWEYLGELFQNGVAENENRDLLWQTSVMGNTVLLMSHLYRAILSGASATMKAEKPELLDQVMGYVEEHLSERLTLAEIARYFYVSESTISQTFRKKMGVSFYRCVTQRRLIAAKTLILEGAALEDINEQVGFADYSTFYRAFKQEYGISPRQFRQASKGS